MATPQFLKTLKPFKPRIVDSLQGYNSQRFLKDLGAGITVGVVALPLAMAFAIASGLEPQTGLFTAIVAGFIISAFGGSSVQIGGPAGAFIVVVLGIVNQYGVANLIVCTLMAGGLLFLMGLTGLGSLVRLIPVSIVIGFTNGIAVLIALSQIKDFFGLNIDVTQGNFFEKNWALLQAIPGLNWSAFALASISLAFLFLWPKLFAVLSKEHSEGTFPKILQSVPGSVILLVAGTLAAYILGLDIETIGSKFGEIPRSLPTLTLPSIELASVQTLIGPTLTIAFLCAIESLLCARVADGITHEKHDPNQELMAQGLANIASPLFGGMPATGTIARTVTNIRSGGNSPVAGIIHALVLLIIMLVAAPLAFHIPLAVLSAVLMFVAYNMGEWREFPKLKQYTTVYRVIMLATFLLTVIVDLTVAVQVGLVLAGVFFIYRVSTLTEFIPVYLKDEDRARGIAAYKIYGSLFFAVVGKIENLIMNTGKSTKILILDLHQTISIDTTALECLEELNSELQRAGHTLIFCGLNSQALSLFKRSGFAAQLQAWQIQDDFSAAMAHAQAISVEDQAGA
ncbi:MAG: STAS domain-containing protein [Limnobacter sp.]|jgi:sulfate permease, SulP family|uniref:SulP family inorganic anion transporter n=1 Tax=unclassified Limnobacter TaxID=2630203 RepID=UPI000C423226|nr:MULTISPECIES: SulP family inorganic anion transporter [unclassified Limnobacter]MAG80731.1 sodium-independent anion transporter [Sutterellaceae bacterium]MBT84873.1 sodium-independent anion transporter [Sutterellaceae bacterium]MDZ4049955.1 SulP family inorganic anion transporter [Limnobacter sp.]RZO94409.1 MAG: STAS domain-containing protein [Limnobacter sp.]HAV75228.1 sodium-independent anion transporter [Limnobacter sp.]|tara:strand:- start:7431 stop:9137 length:1707 start_codon:yes stop_codon:yes gene_type:complete